MKLTKNENAGYQMMTGFFTGKVIAFNPSREQVSKLLGFENDTTKDEYSYTGTTRDGDDFVKISVWIEADTAGKKKFKHDFMIVNKKATNKAGDKHQWVNQVGKNQWVDSASNLWSSFTNYTSQNKEDKTKWDNIAECEHRIALQGEANFYTFLRAWVGAEGSDYKQAKVNFFDPTQSVLMDTKKLFRDVDKFVKEEFIPMMVTPETEGSGFTGNICTMATVRADKNGKLFQELYSGFMSGYMMRNVNIIISTQNWEGNGKYLKDWKKDFDGGNKDAFSFTNLQPFDPNSYMPAGDDVIRHEDNVAIVDDTDY